MSKSKVSQDKQVEDQAAERAASIGTSLEDSEEDIV